MHYNDFKFSRKIGVGKKIGILTWHYYSNFGSRLQAFALQTVLMDLGFEPIIINYQNKKFSRLNRRQRVKNIIKPILNKLLGNIKIFNGAFDFCDYIFEKDFLNQTRLINSKEELPKVAKELHAIVYGADQIWAPNVFNDIYMGAGTNVKKISYAASIGLPTISTELIEKYEFLLKKFYKISVREETGQKLLKELCGIDSSVVLDPTLLIRRDRYESIERKPSRCMDDEFVFCYFLNENNNYYENVIRILGNHNFNVYGVSLNKKDESWIKNLKEIGPREFIWFIDHAKYVFTDSYHGTIFSMIFHKDFYTFERFEKNDPINQNSRIYQLDKWFDIKDRIIGTGTFVGKKAAMNYNVFENRINVYREKSLAFLKEALREDVKV